MNKTFKYIIVLAAVIIGSTSASARLRNSGVVNTDVTGGTVDIKYQVGEGEPVAVTPGTTEVPKDAIVTVSLTADVVHTLTGATVTAELSFPTDQAQARSLIRGSSSDGLGIGSKIEVSGIDESGSCTFTMPDGIDVGLTVRFADKPCEDVAYINAAGILCDGQGDHPAKVKAYVLDGTETVLGVSGQETWYVCKTLATANSGAGLTYDHQLDLFGDVRLILADGSKMTITSSGENGIYGESGNSTNFAIYGQAGDSGILDVSCSGHSAIYVSCNMTICGGDVNVSGASFGINSHGDDIVITGGTVTVSGSEFAIDATSRDVIISGGNVTATGNYGIYAYRSVAISGGQVEASKIYANGSGTDGGITLGWTSADDYVKAESYSAENGVVKTANGKRFAAYNMASEGDLTASAIVSGSSKDSNPTFALTDIAGKTLRPINGYCVATANSHVTFGGKTKPDFSIGGKYYYIYEEAAVVKLGSGEEGVNIDVSDLPDGTTYDASQNTFIMPGDDMTITLSRYMANVDYMDWDATDAQLVKKNTGSDSNTANDKVYILDGYEQFIGQNGKETWYVCKTPASNNSGKGLEYSSATISDFDGIGFVGNVHLILADGSKMSVSMEDDSSGFAAIDGHTGGFTIHGQGGTTEGILDVTATNSLNKAVGIRYSYDDINICGGNINIVSHVTGDNHGALGIFAEYSNLNIYGGNIYIRSWDEKKASSRGLYATFQSNSTHGSGNVNILGGTVNVITSANATTNDETYAIYAEDGNVTISNATVTTHGFYAIEDNGVYNIVTNRSPRYGIYALSVSEDGSGKVIITGDANIDATGETGIRGDKLVQINSGIVSASRISSGGDIEINGGQVDSHTTIINHNIDNLRIDVMETIDPNNTDETLHYPGDALHADGSIILGWNAATDYVRAYRISTGTAVGEAPAVVKTAADKRFVAYNEDDSDPDNPVETPAAYFAGNTTLTDAELASLNAPVCYKVFRPIAGAVLTVPDNVSVVGKTADFSITTVEGDQAVTTPYYLYNSTAQSPLSANISYDGEGFAKLGGLPEGTALTAVEGKPMQRSFTMPAQDVALTTTAVTGFSVSGYYTYSGSAQTPSIKYGDNLSMNADDDFIVTGITKGGTTVTEAIDAGDYSLTIAGVGSYLGTASGIAFSIKKKPVYGSNSNIFVGEAIYNGGVVIPEIELKDDNNNVIASSEYTVNIVSYDVVNQVIDYGNGNSLSSVMDVGIYYAFLYGKAESNYDIQTSTAFTVSPKPVGISWSTDALVYDGTDKAPAASATGVEDVDAGKVSVEVSVEGDHVKAGNYTATASALSGNRASNYKLPASSDAGFATLTKAFAISPKPVTVSGTGVTADNKTYDGTTDATVSGTFAFDAGMIIGSDVVSISGATGTFADKNVGTGKTVTISGITLEGDDAGNYLLDTENQTPIISTADIAAKTVTVTSGITASNKTYDGRTSATLSGSSAVISGKVTSDKLTVSATGKFGDKNAGTGKTVTISSISLTGSDRGNYVLATTGNQATATASITKKSLIVTADDKSVEYGDAAPTYTASYSGFVSGESKSNLSGSLSFSCSYTSSSNTGTYTITPSGHTSSNYSISYAAGTLTVGAKDVAYSGGTVTKDENGYTVTLNEGTGSANTLPDDADLYSLTYSRTLTPPGSGEGEATIGGQAANLYTVCLPFSPKTGTDVKYYTLSGVSGETVSFEEVTTPAANTPYLIAVTGSTNIAESCTGMVVTSMEINSTTKDGYTFTGTFTGLTPAQAVGKHILQSHNKWRVVEENGSVFIPPFRAYIESTNGARMLTGCLDDEATGIDSLRLQDADGTEQWYDLNGRRISKPTRKGVYIHNGKVTTKR